MADLFSMIELDEQEYLALQDDLNNISSNIADYYEQKASDTNDIQESLKYRKL